MDREQATEILKHILEAFDSIDRAGEIILGIDGEDRVALSDPVREIVSVLHFGLLPAVYFRYPDLRPPGGERPIISTFHRWEDLALPESVSEADLDSIILSFASSLWQKTAMVIVRAHKRCEELALPIDTIDTEVLGLRILALAETDRLDSQGDVRKWRHSEIRLKS
jgi:hypothetical protein